MTTRSGTFWLVIVVTAVAIGDAQAVESQWVRTGTSGRLVYVPDAQGDRIMDFSGVGYRGRGVELIPDNVPNMITLSPIAGDDTANIQAAINSLAAMTPGPDGFRGAVLLEAGHYDINSQLVLNASGIVLRGVGRDTSDTVLHGRGTGQRPLIRVLGAGSQSLQGSTRNMIDKVVPVGATSFRVDSVAGFTVGDTVRIERPSPANWIEDLGMDEFGWSPGSFDIRYDRVITRIEGNRLFLDAPLANSFDQQYGGGTIRRYTWADRIENVGIENLRAESDFASLTDENHAWEFVSIENAQNVWVRHTTSQYFGDSAVVSNPTAKWVTVDDAVNLDPRSIVTGERRYTFDLSGQLELVTNSEANSGRHDFVNNSTRPPGPHVFHNSVSNNALNDAGPHQRWATGSLFDNITINGHQLNARNRGDLGTGHGWSGANMVIWNSTATGGFIVQSPPTAQNWLVGSTGPLLTDTTYGPHLPAYVDSHGTPVTTGGTTSLYEAQLNDTADIREFHWAGGEGNWHDDLNWKQGVQPGVYRVSNRDYLVGDIDGFVNDGGASVDNAYIDPVWQSEIQSLSGLPITKFDDLSANKNVAFTVQHQLDGGERVIHGYLALSMRQSGDSAADDFIRLFDTSPENTLGFAELGWHDQVNSSAPFVGVIDVSGRLDKLQSGSVNVQLSDDTGVDWAMYVVTVATPISSSAGPFVYLDGGGVVVVDDAVNPVSSLHVGGTNEGTLQLSGGGALSVQQDFMQATNGTLVAELSEQFPASFSIDVQGMAVLNGTLEIQLADEFLPAIDDTFQILTAAGGLELMFDTVALPALPAGRDWSLNADDNSLWLSVVDVRLLGDFNGDGTVDAADYSVWRDHLGTDFDLNGNGDEEGTSAGNVDAADYALWKQNFGGTFASGSGAVRQAVPEPGAVVYLLMAMGITLGFQRRSRRFTSAMMRVEFPSCGR